MGIANGEHLRKGETESERQRGTAITGRVLGARSMVVVGVIAALGLYPAFTALMPGNAHVQPASVAMNAKTVAPAAAVVASAAAREEQPQHRAAPSHRTPPRHQVVTKCIHAGRVSFTDAPCEAGARTEQLAVNPDRNLTDGLLPSQVERSASAQPETPRDTSVAQADPDALRRTQCEALQARVHAIDERAGEPLDARTQDQLADLRREYRDAQFRLRC